MSIFDWNFGYIWLKYKIIFDANIKATFDANIKTIFDTRLRTIFVANIKLSRVSNACSLFLLEIVFTVYTGV